MSETTLFSVPLEGESGLSTCQGTYHYDPDTGYTGKLFINGYMPAHAMTGLFDLPPALDGTLIGAITEQGKYVTFCYPRFTRRSWSNFSTLIAEFTFQLLVVDLHIGEDDESIISLSIACPTLASFAGIRPVAQSFTLPLSNCTATFAMLEQSTWPDERFTVKISDEKQIGALPDHSEVHFRSNIILTLDYPQPRAFRQAIADLQMIDDMIAVMGGSYSEIKQAAVRISVPSDSPPPPQESFPLNGYGTGYHAVPFVHWHDVLCHMPLASDWGRFVRTFAMLWHNHQIAFKWFRSSQVNKRYLEEKFSYAIRLTERYFRPDEHEDREADRLLRTIRQRLEGDATLEEIVQRRITPMLAGVPSLLTTLQAVFARFPTIGPFSHISPRDVVRLRGREMHGGERHYSNAEYRVMHEISAALLLAFRLAVLESCHLDTTTLLKRASTSTFSRNLFEEASP